MRKLDLRTGRPVWAAYRSKRPDVQSLKSDLKTDVLIVGAGISGAMAADLLSEAGLDVALIDRRDAVSGSTPATTALVQHEIDVPLSHLRRSLGVDKATRAWRRSRLAVQNLRDRIGELGIDCALADRPTLYLAGNVLTGSKLRKEAQMRFASGLSARYLTKSQLDAEYGIARDGAILSQDNLALDPVKLTGGLLERAIARGARLFAPVEATQIDHGRSDVRVETRDGPIITAKHVVLATGYELMDGVPHANHEVISTWAIATGKQKRRDLWPSEALIWEASDPYLYLRTTHDGRVICGGEDEDFTDEDRRDSLIADKTQRIVEKLGKLLPNIDPTPDFSWAGSFGSTSTGLPMIGPLKGKPRVYALMGYGGNGITFSRIAAEIITGAIVHERDDEDADLFALK
ncbi:NAD(P)/FAD-dependent oxidoreductase [Aliihoeflea sp. PC F10.4]